MILSCLVVSIRFISNVVKQFAWPHLQEKVKWLKSCWIEEQPIRSFAGWFCFEFEVRHLQCPWEMRNRVSTQGNQLGNHHLQQSSQFVFDSRALVPFSSVSLDCEALHAVPRWGHQRWRPGCPRRQVGWGGGHQGGLILLIRFRLHIILQEMYMSGATVLIISIQSHDAMGPRVIFVTTGLVMVFSETLSELNLGVSAEVQVAQVQSLNIPT